MVSVTLLCGNTGAENIPSYEHMGTHLCVYTTLYTSTLFNLWTKREHSVGSCWVLAGQLFFSTAAERGPAVDQCWLGTMLLPPGHSARAPPPLCSSCTPKIAEGFFFNSLFFHPLHFHGIGAVLYLLSICSLFTFLWLLCYDLSQALPSSELHSFTDQSFL